VSKWRCFFIVTVIVFIILGLKGYSLFKATQPNAIVYWQVSNEHNTQKISHYLFDELLASNVNDSAVLRTLDYKNISASDKKKLTTYLTQLQSIDPRLYSKDEQLAYWVNLYNALVVNLVITHYPIDSIKNIGDGFTGPWNIELANISGKPITLNKIEHGILRPLWKDSRIHYVINCASTGCPDLPTQSFSSVNINQQLNSAAVRFVNQNKGVNVVNNNVTLSSIYKWFSVDFGSSDQHLINHLKKYALPPLRSELEVFSDTLEYDYDWSLNATKVDMNNNNEYEK